MYIGDPSRAACLGGHGDDAVSGRAGVGDHVGGFGGISGAARLGSAGAGDAGGATGCAG